MGEMEGMHVFPPGSTLPAGGVILIANRASAFYQNYGVTPDYEVHDTGGDVPDLLKYSAWSGGNLELVNGGDEVLLLDGENLIADGLSWGSARSILDPPAKVVAPDHSLERIPAYRDTDTAEDWIDQYQPTPGVVDTSPPTPTPTTTPEATLVPTGTYMLLISEVIYRPSAEPAGEWIEIYNWGETKNNLAGLRLGDEETPGDGEGMLVFPVTALVNPGEAVVVANQSASFKEQYGFDADYEMNDSDPLVPDLFRDLARGSGLVILSNSGDEVILLAPDGTILDGLSWGSSDVILSPSVPGVDQGSSLERYPPGLDTDSASDWRAQPNPDPGNVDLVQPTPTATATGTLVPTPPPTLVINEIHADPDTVLGDANNDGVINSIEDEFVEIVNLTGSPVNLSGWMLGDLTGARHFFPVNSLIADQCALLVFGGGQPQGAFGGSLVQVASLGSLGLNNSGDVLFLADLSGSQVLTYTFGSEGGDNQSLVRYPDITGLDPLIKHSAAPGSNGAIYSPGTGIDGAIFSGCSAYKQIWIKTPDLAPGGSP